MALIEHGTGDREVCPMTGTALTQGWRDLWSFFKVARANTKRKMTRWRALEGLASPEEKLPEKKLLAPTTTPPEKKQSKEKGTNSVYAGMCKHVLDSIDPERIKTYETSLTDARKYGKKHGHVSPELSAAFQKHAHEFNTAINNIVRRIQAETHINGKVVFYIPAAKEHLKHVDVSDVAKSLLAKVKPRINSLIAM